MSRHPTVLTLMLAAALGLATTSASAAKAADSPAQIAANRSAAYPFPNAWLLHKTGEAVIVVHGSELAETIQTPASTIKPLLALIALQTGALRDADEILPWDGQRYPGQAQWEKDMALAEAMRTSSESYFRLLANRIGRDRLAAWVARIGYGNGIIGERADKAWHGGTLTITAHQQLQFVDQLRTYDLPFDRQIIDTVKRTMLVVDKNGVQIYGKTGTSMPPGAPGLAWWVGWVERGDTQTSFVLQAQLTEFDGRKERIAYANQLLVEAGVLSELP